MGKLTLFSVKFCGQNINKDNPLERKAKEKFAI